MTRFLFLLLALFSVQASLQAEAILIVWLDENTCEIHTVDDCGFAAVRDDIWCIPLDNQSGGNGNNNTIAAGDAGTFAVNGVAIRAKRSSAEQVKKLSQRRAVKGTPRPATLRDLELAANGKASLYCLVKDGKGGFNIARVPKDFDPAPFKKKIQPPNSSYACQSCVPSVFVVEKGFEQVSVDAGTTQITLGNGKGTRKAASQVRQNNALELL